MFVLAGKTVALCLCTSPANAGEVAARSAAGGGLTRGTLSRHSARADLPRKRGKCTDAGAIPVTREMA
jgi:hypothetical protein